jgi:maltose alpha-D-glucosyltransferase/alpha-amylase
MALPAPAAPDAPPSENLPQTHAFLKKLRAHIDKHYEERILIAEAIRVIRDRGSSTFGQNIVPAE